MDNIFSIDSVHAGYGKSMIFRGLNFAAGRGEFVSFIGPNGAGKSTLLRLLTGAMQPASGSVTFCGRDIKKYSARELARNFSVVTAITGEVPDFTVKAFVEFGLYPYSGLGIHGDGKAEQRVDEISERTGISGLAERSINEISTGEFQLVQVTRALVQNSSVIILDEPVSNLDYRHSTMVMDILKDLNRTGTTVLCALHDVNCASNYSSRIVCVKNGSVVIDGSPIQVVNAVNMGLLYDWEFVSLLNPATGSPMVVPVPG